jgi:hypothetical protein
VPLRCFHVPPGGICIPQVEEHWVSQFQIETFLLPIRIVKKKHLERNVEETLWLQLLCRPVPRESQNVHKRANYLTILASHALLHHSTNPPPKKKRPQRCRNRHDVTLPHRVIRWFCGDAGQVAEWPSLQRITLQPCVNTGHKIEPIR